MHRWDEARLSAKAYEMYQSGNLIVPHYNGSPDMWSTKPPLMIWMQALSFKIFGVSTLSARLPSVVCAFLTVLLLIWFFAVKQKNAFKGIVVSLVLLTTAGYIKIHGVRTGDYDSMLTLFTTGYIIFFYHYLQGKNAKYLLLTFVFIALGALTKGVQAFLFLPGLFIMVIFYKQVISILKTKQFYIGLFTSAFFVVGYYFLREYYNPGYIDAVLENEWGGRALNALEGHYGGPYFYTEALWTEPIFWILLIPAILIFALGKNIMPDKFLLYTLVVGVVYLVIISAVKTKLSWYLMPLYPLLAIIAGSIIIQGIKAVTNAINPKSVLLKKLVTTVLTVAVFFYPYKQMLAYTYHPDFYIDDGHYFAGLLHELEKGNDPRNLEGITFVYRNMEQEVYWYYLTLSEKYNLKLKTIDVLGEGERVVTFKNDAIAKIQERFDYTILDQYYNVVFYRINGPATDTTSTPE